MTRSHAPTKSPRGIQSAGVAVRILRAFGDSEGPLHLREIASAAVVDASNAYRYLVSFAEVGMVQQQADGRYDLGPLAIRLGLVALSRLDEFKVVTSELDRLVDATGLDAHATLWGTAGPTVARWRRGERDLSVHVREGTVFPLTGSATGRVWSAFQNPAKLDVLLEIEFDRLARDSGRGRGELQANHQSQIEQVRASGISFSQGERQSGVNALCGPIRDRNGDIIFSLTVLGLASAFDVSLDGEVANALRHTLVRTSIALGATAPPFESYFAVEKATG